MRRELPTEFALNLILQTDSLVPSRWLLRLLRGFLRLETLVAALGLLGGRVASLLALVRHFDLRLLEDHDSVRQVRLLHLLLCDSGGLGVSAIRRHFQASA